MRYEEVDRMGLVGVEVVRVWVESVYVHRQAYLGAILLYA
jgi:hypothetical protein